MIYEYAQIENIIAYDGEYEDGKFIPLDEMPPHKGRHRAILLLIDEATTHQRVFYVESASGG